MKIGILTYHCVPNFGAQLQTLSTIGFLKRMGHQPIVLHWYPKDLEDMYSKRVPKEQIEIHDQFTNSVFPLSNLCRTEKELIHEIQRLEIEGIIVGSDALFKYVPSIKRKAYFSKRTFRLIKPKVLSVEDIGQNPFFCDFYDQLTTKIPICAFSVSSQNCPFQLCNPEEKAKLSKAISNFSDITVRDEWTKKMVEYLTGRQDIKVTPDPVFDFNNNCYIKIPSKEELIQRFNLEENYVLISFRTNHIPASYIHNLVSSLEAINYSPVAFPMPEGLKDYGIKKKISLPLSPIDWYALIIHSKGYIGERMHPIVVSVHNAIPFFCFDEYGVFQKNFWGLVRTYIQESSKTFHILNKAGLTKFLFSYKGKEKMPDCSHIVDSLKTFDTQRCKEFAQIYSSYYESSMGAILSKIENLVKDKL